MYLSTNVDKKPLLNTVDQAVKNLYHNPADAFFTGRAMDLMFGNCFKNINQDISVFSNISQNIRIK